MSEKYLPVAPASFHNCLPVGMSRYKNIGDGFCYGIRLFVGSMLADCHP